MAKRGAPMKYNKKTLMEAVDAYFRSISYLRPARDEKGKLIRNIDGEMIHVLDYAVPPSITGLCNRLGIDIRTWDNYAKRDSTAFICAQAKQKCKEWNLREVCTRDRPQGIIFNLQANYGCQQRQELALEEKTRKDLAASGMTLTEKLEWLSEAAMTFGQGGDGDGSPEK